MGPELLANFAKALQLILYKVCSWVTEKTKPRVNICGIKAHQSLASLNPKAVLLINPGVQNSVAV